MVTIIKNQTGIEAWIVEKANYRRTNSKEKFLYPYSKDWLFNIKQVISWNCVPVGNGIDWPVVEGCDQYTLTVKKIVIKVNFKIVHFLNRKNYPVKYFKLYSNKFATPKLKKLSSNLISLLSFGDCLQKFSEFVKKISIFIKLIIFSLSFCKSFFSVHSKHNF